jgi:predicted metal-dependent peptidase|tara:strand:- start:2866 stop:4074 length:1209 start_codon:yes stop_codon:yes gene_type:complete
MEYTNAGEKLQAARIKMLFQQPFFGNIACRLKLVECDPNGWCNTAATDGRNFYYNPEFVMSLDIEETVFLVGHELGHCMYEHFLRVGDRHKQYWNMAGDYKINAMLVKEKIGRLITTVKPLYDPQFESDDWWTETIYDLLMKTKPAIKETLDIHLDMAGEDAGSSSNGKGDVQPTISEDDAKAISDELKNAMIQASQAVGAGNVPSDIKRMIGQLTAPKMDWRQLIRVSLESNVRNDFTFMTPNRKSQFSSCVIPGMVQDQEIDICIGLDMSGSIGQTDSVDFLSEVQGIMDQFGSYRIRVWCFDTDVYAYDEFTSDDGRSITEYQIRGGGGTDFVANWKYMKEHDIVPDQFIMFTDGVPWRSWGDPDYCDTMFLIKNSFSKPVAPFGQSVYYESAKVKEAA